MKNLWNSVNWLMRGALCVLGFSCGLVSAQTNNLVFLDGNGNLQYGTYANQGETNAFNTVPDFSSVGYKRGGVAIPLVPAVVTVNAPTGGDDKALIQNAINTVAGMAVGTNGFRGAVLIKAGNYKVASTININASGIVIRGEGSHTNGGTRITMTATVQDNLFSVKGSGYYPSTGSQASITDTFVPSGSKSFNVSSAAAYAAGNNIRLHYKMNTNWIAAIGMDNIIDSVTGSNESWTVPEFQLYYDRVVTAVTGNTIYVDAPLVQPIENQYGGADVYKLGASSGLITNVGLEALRLESTYTNDTDEAHGWIAIWMGDVKDAWVRQVTAKYFGYGCVKVSARGFNVTVEDCAMVDPKSITTGSRKYSFNVADAQQVLMQRCYTWGGRHDFVTDSKTPGPNVFVDCLASNTFADVGPHFRWATGELYDNIKCGELRVQNRWDSGTGHGWSGAQILFWNSESPSIICDAPSGAMNFAIGCVGSHDQGVWRPAEPDGIWQSHNTNVAPRSLYYRQLQVRLGRDAVRNVILPSQETGKIWTALTSWAGEGLFGSNVIAWASESMILPPTNSIVVRGQVRNLKMLDNGATSMWSKVTGPGVVTFGDATKLETTASFSTTGVYVVRLTVSAGAMVASYDLNVRYGNTAPVVDAGTNQTVSTSWTPAQASTRAWYDASDANTVKASSGSVTNWVDKSGNGYDLSQTNASARPATGSRTLNGLNTLDFNGTNSLGSSAAVVTGNPDLMMVAVRAFDSNVAGNDMIAILGNGTGGQTAAIAGGTGGYSWRFFNGYQAYGPVTTNAAAIQIGVRSASSNYLASQMWLNGAQISRTAGSSDTSTPNIAAGINVCGVGGYMDGAIGEIIVLQDSSASTRQNIEGYLAHKWGLTNSLPAGHPYNVYQSKTANLDATVSDADGDMLTVNWTVTSGPGLVTFVNSNGVDTVAMFTAEGVYVLRLTATDGIVQAYDEITITVTAPTVPVANFTASATNGVAPLNVSFTDTSTGAPTSWRWDFDNDTVIDSTDQNPSHTFAAGMWTVSLIVSNANGASSPYTTNITVITAQQSFENAYGVTADGTDSDGDGQSNWAEFQAGFDPTNSAAYLRVINVLRAGEDLQIVYLGANGDTSYPSGPVVCTNVLEFAASLTNNFATTGQTNFLGGGTGTGIVTNFFVPNGATFSPARYYRIRL